MTHRTDLEKQFDQKLLMEKIEASLENAVNGVMQAGNSCKTTRLLISSTLNLFSHGVFLPV